MKRSIAMILAMLLAFALLWGCTPKETPGTEPSQIAPQQTGEDTRGTIPSSEAQEGSTAATQPSSHPTEETKPSETTKPAETAQPTQSSETTQPTEAAGPTESTGSLTENMTDKA